MAEDLVQGKEWRMCRFPTRHLIVRRPERGVVRARLPIARTTTLPTTCLHDGFVSCTSTIHASASCFASEGMRFDVHCVVVASQLVSRMRLVVFEVA